VLGLVRTWLTTPGEWLVSERKPPKGGPSAAAPPGGREGARPEQAKGLTLVRPSPESEELRSRKLSALLEELARAPAPEQAWKRGLRAGEKVGRYEIQRELGRGGFGVVYEALDRELGRAVACKAVRRESPRSDEWLSREAEAVARLNHPNIVTLHDLGRGPTGPYLIFELLRGETLADRLKAGALPLRRAVEVGVEVTRALAHAHAARVVHRDLKPANVFLSDDGAVKVLDFGLAQLFGKAGPPTAGTPAYMAPEQWRAEPGDERTDLFALGVLLHQTISGELPYRVHRERSEAQDPGPAPWLPAGSAPAPLRRLVHSLLAKAASDRPASAQQALDELLRVAQALAREPRRRLLWIAAVAASALVAALLAYWITREPTPGERITVAVPDFANHSGERDLDGLSGLLIPSLEQSRQVVVLTRTRLRDLLRRAGRGDAETIDERLGREAAQLGGAGALLVGSLHRFGDRYTVELVAFDLRADRPLFSVREEAESKEAIKFALDRVSDEARRRLRERASDIQGFRIRIEDLAPGNPEAWRHYFVGVDCLDRPTKAGSWSANRSCGEHFRKAVGMAPTFAMAHYQLAWLLTVDKGPPAERDAHMAAALAGARNLPFKEGLLVQAWKARIDGRTDEAWALYQRVLVQYPDDKRVLSLAGELAEEGGDHAVALPYFQRVLDLDPGDERALDAVVESLARLRRLPELRALADRLRREEPSEARGHALTRSLVWLGDAPGAVAVARVAAGGGGEAARRDLGGALLAAGEVSQAEEVFRAIGPTASPSLAAALVAQGRLAEGLAVLEGPEGAGEDRGHLVYIRANLLAGGGDAEAVFREAMKARALRPDLAPDLAVLLAMLSPDRPERGQKLGADVAPRSAADEALQALRAWQSGDAVGAAARLVALEQRDPWPVGMIAPSMLLAEVSAGSGDHREAIEAVRRFHALWPRGPWRSWAYPRSLYLLARSHEALGQREEARRQVDRLLALWSRADEGLPLLRQAREQRARLER